MQIDPITAALGSTAASTTSVNGVNNFESYLNNAGNNSLASIFQKASDTYGVSVSLLTAMAKQESNFQANATSKSGAMGIMQLMPSTASYFGCTDPYDPEQNIMAGAKYISELLNKYNGDTSLALAAYNAGSGNVAKYGGIPPFKETQNYVKKIMADYTGNNTILAGRTVSTGTYGKTSGSTAVSSLIGSGLTGSGLTAGSLLGSFAGNTGLSGAGSLGTLLAAGKGENLSGEDWSNMVQILRLQMMMNMGKDTGTLI